MLGECANLCLTQVAGAGTILCMAQPQLVTKREAAEILGVHPSTVNRMIPDRLKVASTVYGPKRAAMHLFRRTDVERLAMRRAA